MMPPVAHVAAHSDAPLFRRFRSSSGEHLLVVPHSRIYDLPPALAASFDADPQTAALLALGLGEATASEVDLSSVVAPSPQSLSLNVSSTCNLSCSYCYADRGAFAGAQSLPMSAEVARAAVARLLDAADPARPITIGFRGGEPLRSKPLIHDIVDWSSRRAQRQRLDVRYSITTNGTLLDERMLDLFRHHPFAVTISVDGDAAAHDAQRPLPNGRGSFAVLARRVGPLLATPGSARVAARMTVRSGRLDLQPRLNAVWALGFTEAGVAPLRVAADDSGLRDTEWPAYLAALVEVAEGELERARRGRPIRLTNLAVALKQIHAGSSSPYACGAGGGYFSVAADGEWYACHRAIGDAAFRLGSSAGLDVSRRRTFLESHHVHAKTDCNACWARYLCSGGCHQEAQARTEAGCDAIRGWLDFCLAAYCELSSSTPESFVPEPLPLATGGHAWLRPNLPS